ncbi:MAG: carboxylesterase family protein [Chitinophagales bacterium]
MQHKFLLFLFQVFSIVLPLSAQNYCIEGRFDQYIFDSLDIKVIQNIQYGTALNYAGDMENLGLDMYFPDTTLDDLEKKPLVMFVHGGGLVGGDKLNGAGIGYDFARRGFVYTSINYRLGYSNLGECAGDTASLQLAIYRGIQDTKAAIRFIKENAHNYDIDTNAIFLIGSSVGATLILYAALATQDNFYNYQYEALGSIDSSTNDLYNHTTTVSAITGRASGVESLEIFKNGNVPTQLFHGTCDFVVPYTEDPLYMCYTPVQYMHYHGSWEIAQYLQANGTPYELYTNEGFDHSAVEEDTLILYAGDFYKSILCNTLQLSTEYYRYNNGGCMATSENDFSISFSPNPFHDELNITVKGARKEDISIELFSYTGQRIFSIEQHFTPPLAYYNLQFNTLFTSQGIYFLRVMGETVTKSVTLFRH